MTTTRGAEGAVRPDRELTLKAAAELTGISGKLLRRYIREGRLEPASMDGNKLTVTVAGLRDAGLVAALPLGVESAAPVAARPASERAASHASSPALERLERERLVRERAERERQERDRQAAENAAREKAEREKAEREKAEREKPDREKAEREKAEREKAEREKAEREKAEQAKAERENADREKADHEKAEREKTEQAKAERERADREKADREKAERDKAEHAKTEREKAERQKADREKAEREKVEHAKAEREKADREKAERAKAEHEKAEREKAERAQADLEKAERERAAAERERFERERAERELAERAKAERDSRRKKDKHGVAAAGRETIEDVVGPHGAVSPRIVFAERDTDVGASDDANDFAEDAELRAADAIEPEVVSGPGRTEGSERSSGGVPATSGQWVSAGQIQDLLSRLLSERESRGLEWQQRAEALYREMINEQRSRIAQLEEEKRILDTKLQDSLQMIPKGVDLQSLEQVNRDLRIELDRRDASKQSVEAERDRLRDLVDRLKNELSRSERRNLDLAENIRRMRARGLWERITGSEPEEK